MNEGFFISLKIMTLAVIAVLLVYGLIILGDRILPLGPSDNDRYQKCLQAGGSYQSADSNYSCELP